MDLPGESRRSIFEMMKKKRRNPEVQKFSVSSIMWCSSSDSKSRRRRLTNDQSEKQVTKHQRYEVLLYLFNTLDFCVQSVLLRNSMPLFANDIAPLFEKFTHWTLTLTHLAQLKFIFPEGIEIDKTLFHDIRLNSMKPDLYVTLKPNTTQIRKLFQQRLIAFFNSNPEDVDIPTPMVVIDQDTHPDATILHVTYGPFLLPDHVIHTMIITPLMDLGFDVSKQTPESQQQQQTRLSIGRKVDDPDLLEHIRLTIISNLLKHPPPAAPELLLLDVVKRMADVNVNVESSESNNQQVHVATNAHAKDDKTKERHELLLEVVKRMADVNVNVKAAGIDT